MASDDRSSELPSAPPPSAVRASDAERERTATQLREHYAAGRLTAEELDERMDRAFAARTVTELDTLLADLPEPTHPPAPPRAPAAARELARQRVLHAAGFAALVSAACIAVWAATGAGAFWPQWVLLASVIRLAFRAWGELGPGATHDETRHGRGGSQPRLPPPDGR